MAATETTSRPDPRSATRKPRFNHVAMSLTADLLDEEHRKAARRLLRATCSASYELPMMTEDRKRQVFQVHTIEQFVFLIADDAPMTCPRLDHFGLVGRRRVRARRHPRPREAWQARDDRVDIIDKKTDDHGMLAIT